jgi:hypothetical protein
MRTIGGRSVATLQKFAHEVTLTTGLTSEVGTWTAWERLDSITFRGNVGGTRAATLSLHAEEPSNPLAVWTVHWRVAAEKPPPLTVTRENLATRLEKWLGFTHEIEVGDAKFDARYLLVTTDETGARHALSVRLRKAIDALFDDPIREVELGGNRILATARASEFPIGQYGRVFTWLDMAARCFDRKPIPVRVLAAERNAFVDETGRTRCPYCHAPISGQEDALVGCEKCHTVLHDECWTELGHCPILGCTGETPERGR